MKTKKDKIYLVLIIVAVLAIAAVIVFSRYDRKEPVQSNLPVTGTTHDRDVVIKEVDKLFMVEKEITADIIRDGLEKMGFLVTQRYFFTEVISFSSVKKLFNSIELGFTESSYLATYDGEVSAGIDFADVTVEKDDELKKITVHLPAAEIRSIDIDPNSFELYSEEKGFNNPVSVKDFNTSLVELEINAREKAIEKGLLTQADENAKSVILNFIAGLVDTAEYTVDIVNG